MQYTDANELLNDKVSGVTEYLLKKINETHPELHQTETSRLRPAARSVIEEHIIEFFGPEVLTQSDPNFNAVQSWLVDSVTVQDFAVQAVGYVYEDEINRLVSPKDETFDAEAFMQSKVEYMANAYGKALELNPDEVISLNDKMRLMNHIIERNDDFLSEFIHDSHTLKDFATKAANFLFEDEVQYHLENNETDLIEDKPSNEAVNRTIFHTHEPDRTSL